MTQRRVDRERLERADRESKLAIEAEREIRNAKTARLREQRLSAKHPPATRVLINPTIGRVPTGLFDA